MEDLAKQRMLARVGGLDQDTEDLAICLIDCPGIQTPDDGRERELVFTVRIHELPGPRRPPCPVLEAATLEELQDLLKNFDTDERDVVTYDRTFGFRAFWPDWMFRDLDIINANIEAVPPDEVEEQPDGGEDDQVIE
jgi:hypothetical protein